jgi:hypothetical protein
LDKQNVVYVHIENYAAMKKNEIMSFAGQWTELDVIMLSKISQGQKDKYHVFAHILTLKKINMANCKRRAV